MDIDNFEWSPPLPPDEGVPLLPWPDNIFPEPFNTFVNELAQSTETPIELASMLTLSAVAAASHQKYHVHVKDDYFEPVNIWTIVVLPPASRKSQVHGIVTSPLKKWEQEQRHQLEPKIKQIESQRKTLEGKIKHLRTQAAKTTSEKNFQHLQAEIEKLENTMPVQLSSPRIWAADVTPETLGQIMANNGEAMAILSDEGGVFDILGGLYSDGRANLDLFLQSFSANSTKVDRLSRGQIDMKRPVLTLGLTTQPVVMQKVCANGLFRGRGLLGRFLMAAPASNIGYRILDVPSMSLKIRQQYEDAIINILHHPNPDNTNRLHLIRTSSEAFKKNLEYSQLVERLMREDIGLLTDVKDWAGRLSGNIIRMAALVHLMRHAFDSPWEHEISPEDMASSIKIGHCLTNHTLNLLNLLHIDENQTLAKRIYTWIVAERLPQFTLRECERQFRKTKTLLLSALKHLEKECNIIQSWIHQPEKGRPSQIFQVNPLVHKMETPD